MNHTFCVFARIAWTRRFLQISKMSVFLKNNMGLSMKNTRNTDFCADRIDFKTNFAVIMNVIIKRVHCITIYLQYFFGYKTEFFSFPNNSKNVDWDCLGRVIITRITAKFHVTVLVICSHPREGKTSSYSKRNMVYEKALQKKYCI